MNVVHALIGADEHQTSVELAEQLLARQRLRHADTAAEGATELGLAYFSLAEARRCAGRSARH